jgi:hypothetical protein
MWRRDRTKLKIESLDDRIVPAAFDLTTSGASAEVNGAIFAQYTDTVTGNDSPSFVRIQNDGTERGYNTDARPVQFHTLTNRTNTRAITVGQVPRREVNGVLYREFMLNVNQTNQRPQLSVNAVKLFLGNTGTLTGYVGGQLAGLDPVYDLDAGGDNTVLVDARLSPGGRQTDDMVLLVPEAVFFDAGATADTFVYLFSRMGATAGARANGDFEEWGIKLDGGGAPVDPNPPPPTGTASLSGRVYIDLDDIDGQDINNAVGIEGVTITLSWVDDQGATQTRTALTDVDGFYTFTDLLPDTYTLTESQPDLHASVESEVGSLGGTAGVEDVISGIVVGDGQAGTEYNFQEISLFE